MDNYMIWGIIAIILLLLANNFTKKTKNRPKNHPLSSIPKEDSIKEEKAEDYRGCYTKTFLMTINEKNQYWKIKEATDKLDLLLFSKVRMIDIVKPKNHTYTLLNKVISKHIDFIVLDKKGVTICAIEIDDNSHNAKERKENDDFKDTILQDVGIPLIRTRQINLTEIEEKLNTYINPNKIEAN